MCGIIGGTNKDWRYKEAVDVLRHRGPDSQQIRHFDDFHLGFARLAIIDLSRNADQPMSHLHANVHIVFNGEIYGYQELRENLISLGHNFRTQSDTEVLLNAYVQWGEEFVDHIDGMFATAIYDQREGVVKLFRDRSGIKPLYYYYGDEQFAFASELKGITTLCHDITFEHDKTALYDYLTYLYVPQPKTLYTNVFKLKPGHRLIYNVKESSIKEIKAYWSLNVDPHPEPVTLEFASEKLHALVKKSVSDQMIADVPVGFFLSGGIDSSLVVAESSVLNDNLSTFSIGFDDERYTEISYAKEVAEHFKTKHHEKILSSEASDKLIRNLGAWYDEPYADTSAMPTYLVSQFAKENVTVVLTGDGGDELWGGYQRYQRYKNFKSKCNFTLMQNSALYALFSKLRNRFKYRSLMFRGFNFLAHLSADDINLYAKLMGLMGPHEKQKYKEYWEIPDDYDDHWFFKEYDRSDLEPLTRLQYMDFHTYLPNDILTKVDRVSMAVSLEARVPLLSKELIEFSFSLPENIKYHNGLLKGLVKQAYKDVLPDSILSRNKKGFNVPLE